MFTLARPAQWRKSFYLGELGWMSLAAPLDPPLVLHQNMRHNVDSTLPSSVTLKQYPTPALSVIGLVRLLSGQKRKHNKNTTAHHSNSSQHSKAGFSSPIKSSLFPEHDVESCMLR